MWNIFNSLTIPGNGQFLKHFKNWHTLEIITFYRFKYENSINKAWELKMMKNKTYKNLYQYCKQIIKFCYSRSINDVNVQIFHILKCDNLGLIVF